LAGRLRIIAHLYDRIILNRTRLKVLELDTSARESRLAERI
jgi:hypothetical protein